jgi:hypothetical protein
MQIMIDISLCFLQIDMTFLESHIYFPILQCQSSFFSTCVARIVLRYKRMSYNMGKAPYNDPEKPKPNLQTMTTYLPTELRSIAHSAARTELLGRQPEWRIC